MYLFANNVCGLSSAYFFQGENNNVKLGNGILVVLDARSSLKVVVNIFLSLQLGVPHRSQPYFLVQA